MEKLIKQILVVFLTVLSVKMKVMATPIPQNGVESVTDDINNAIGQPSTRILDLNNVDKNVLEQLQTYNINLTALRAEQARLRSRKMREQDTGEANVPVPAPLIQNRSVDDDDNADEDLHRRQYEGAALDKIKNIIETSLIRNTTTVVPTNVVTHEIAFPALCEIPRNTNESIWLNSNTWNLFFRIPSKKFTLTSAVLRLYKNKDEETEVASNCTDQIDQLLKITVSVYVRRAKRGDSGHEHRKRVCSTTTISKTFAGWIEMDIKLAVKQWEKSNRNLGLAIEVQDGDDNYLRAGDYFHPIDCNQASNAFLPWSFYKHTLSYSSHEMVRVPHSPRVDVMWTTGTVKTNYQQRTHHFHHFTHQQQQQQQQTQDNLRYVRHNLDHHNFNSDSMEENNTGEEDVVETVDDEDVVVVDTQPHRRRHHLHNRHKGQNL